MSFTLSLTCFSFSFFLFPYSFFFGLFGWSVAQVEKIPGGELEDSKVLRGVMLNKDVVHSDMRRRIEKPRILLLDCNLEYTKGESKTDMEVCLFAVCLLLVCLFACLLVFLFAWLFYFILFFPSLLADSSVPISNTRKHTHTLLPASRRLQCCTPAFFAVALVPLLGHSS